MKTPDGQQFKKRGRVGRLFAGTGRLLLSGLLALGRFGLLLLRAIGKLIATIWRLTGALDAALWRGAKLFARSLWRSMAAITLIIAAAFGDLIRWVPTRWGRAYSAICGVWLIVFALWIIDELRTPPSLHNRPGENPGGAPIDLDDPILARIEGRYVHLSEVAAAARASGALRDDEILTPALAFERDLVKAYVEQRLLARAAGDEGLQRQPQTARQINAARERILAAAYMEQQIAATVTDSAVERLYRAQVGVTRLGDEVRARQIVVNTGEQAESILEKLKAGTSFEDLARRYSKDRTTAMSGGDLGYFSREMMDPALSTAAFSTPIGEIAPVFRTEFGWHILQVLDRRKMDGIPFDAVRDNIKRFLTLRTIEATLNQLKADNDVVFYPPSPPKDAGADGALAGGSAE